MQIPHTLYRCDECHVEQLVSDQDILKSKLDGWMTMEINVIGGSGHTKNFCKRCAPHMLDHYNTSPMAPRT